MAHSQRQVGTFRPRLNVLSEEQIDEIHLATLEILERIGVYVTNPEALELLRGAGAWVVSEDRVKIPSFLVEQALRTAPPRVVLWTRDGEPALFLEGSKYYFGSMTDCPTYLDPYSGEQRPFVSEDVFATATVNDYCPNVDFIMFAGQGADIPEEVADRIIFRKVVADTSKPVGFSAADGDGLRDIVEMAALVAGGYGELRQRPFLACYCEPITPLRHSPEGVDRLFICADEWIPVIYAPMPTLGGTAPCTPAGCIATANAESLTGLVLHQLRNPGAPFIYGAVASVMDMKTSILSYGAPEMSLMAAAMTDMAHRYHLPMFGTAGVTDSKEIDQQAAVEAAVSCFASATSGANLIHNLGMLNNGTTVSPEFVVLADEIVGMVNRIMEGIPVDEENLALDILAEVGPGGEFVTHEHTYRHFKDMWYPEIFDRSRYEVWKLGDQLSLREKVAQKTRQILDSYRCEPLHPDVNQELSSLERKWLKG